MSDRAAGWYTSPTGEQIYWDGNEWGPVAPRPRAPVAPSIAQPATRPTAAPTGKAALACPHCGVRGKVKTWRKKQKRGVSGGKATGAVLTGGLSILATGLSRKEWVTYMYCKNCKTKWAV